MFVVGQTVWIAYTLAQFPAIVTRVFPADRHSQGKVQVKELDGADLGTYPDNLVFDHEPHQEARRDDYGEYTVWV